MFRPSFALVRKYGPNKVIATVYRHGAPPTLSALIALMDDDAQHEQWKHYVADVACRMVRLWSKKSNIPSYSELVKKQKGNTDSRTGQEIVDSIIAKRKRKKAEREVKKSHETIQPLGGTRT